MTVKGQTTGYRQTARRVDARSSGRFQPNTVPSDSHDPLDPTTVELSQFDRLVGQLRASKTVTDLFKLANGDDFKASARTLSSDVVAKLREVYRETFASLDGKVRLEQFDGQILHVLDIGYWHSAEYDNEGVTLTFRPETDQSKRFKALTSSARIVRFCNGLDVQPTADAPLRVQVKLGPVTDPERAAKGQKIWSIKRLPMPQSPNVGGSPF